MKFRKKPVVIEAEQFTEWETEDDGHQYVTLHGKRFPVYRDVLDENRAVIFISTMEGDMAAPLGYWVIKGVQGELYGCQPDIFEQTYEKVND
jgi:hypothetical protein